MTTYVYHAQHQDYCWYIKPSGKKRLLVLYGNDVCFLDATYKTTRYALPLFLICVRTNAGYCVIAIFLVQQKDSASVTEALQMIRSWNPTWFPSAFMLDFLRLSTSQLWKLFQVSTVMQMNSSKKVTEAIYIPLPQNQAKKELVYFLRHSGK